MAERMLMSVLPFPFHSFVALIGRGNGALHTLMSFRVQ
jgi:hypothetical protein